jgi:ribonucleoside-triphosphate reductase (thioredoxin)
MLTKSHLFFGALVKRSNREAKKVYKWLDRQFSSKFALPKEFVESYKKKRVNFGFNGLGEIAYLRTYSRKMEDGTNEQWADTVERIVNGCFNMQREFSTHSIDMLNTQVLAMRMYDKIFNFKFLPPGRGLWAMGSQITEKKKLYTALNNWAFVSTDVTDKSKTGPFVFLMDSSMLGVGVGFDTKGADMIKIYHPNQDSAETFVIPDTREGWVESVRKLLQSYFELNQKSLKMDYSLIRPKGRPLKVFGGVSSGPEPLIELHNKIREKLDSKTSESTLGMRDIVDLMNFIGKCVVAGNIRRSAEIAMGEYNDTDFIELKNYEKNPERMEYGWVSNNSILAKLGMDYTTAVDNIIKNGEPGFAWIENMRNYSRMCDSPDYKDEKAVGGNPCLEQTLESYEMCTLVETFPNHHTNYRDFQDTLELAFLYAKTVTLGLSHWEPTNEVMARNRRIGWSMSGIAQFVSDKGLHTLK